jgi:hypothetical protein
MNSDISVSDAGLTVAVGAVADDEHAINASKIGSNSKTRYLVNNNAISVILSNLGFTKSTAITPNRITVHDP